jgi:hypothetical protein
MIFDVDKSSDDRGTPKPNSHDRLTPGSVPARGTLSTNYTTALPNISGLPASQLGALTLVQVNTATVVNTGATLTTAQASHGLGYVPVVLAFINNANITVAGGTVTGASLMLPTFTSASIGGVTSGAVTFGTWLQAFTDVNNVYINLYNATGNPVTVTITYYLYRQLAAQ